MRRGHLGLCASQLSDRKATASSSSSSSSDCYPDCVSNLREQGLISQLSSSSSGFFL